MKKIVFFMSSLNLGGIEKTLIEVVNSMDKNTFDITVCIKNGDELKLLSQLNKKINVEIIRKIEEVEMLKKNKNKNKLFYKIKLLLQKKLEKERFKKVIEKSDILVDYYDGNFYKEFSRIKSLNKEKYCFLHAMLENLNINKKGNLDKVLSSYDKIFTVSDGIKKCLEENLKNPREIIRLYNPFNIARIKRESNSELGLSLEEKELLKGSYILAASRLDERHKDYKTLIESFLLLKRKYKRKEKLYIAGDGKSKGDIERLVKDLNLDEEVVFLGLQKNPYIWMKNSKCFVHSSKSEGFGNVLIEAMASKTPVISTNCYCGPREIIQDGYNGCLVEVGKKEEMAEKIYEVLNNLKLQERVIKNANLDIIKYDISFIIKEYEEKIGG